MIINGTFLGRNGMKLVTLSSAFYGKHLEHSEILENKNGRPYVVLLVKAKKRTFAIPFRTSGRFGKNSPNKPKTCYYFSSSGRNFLSSAGRVPVLDFIKAVVVSSEDLGTPACIDKKDFRELSSNFKQIRSSFEAYLDYYIDAIRNGKNLDAYEIKYSSLQYFHDLLLDVK